MRTHKIYAEHIPTAICGRERVRTLLASSDSIIMTVHIVAYGNPFKAAARVIQ